ncbi:NAD-dependent epimerase/dehydratase family protein [archaeon]|nr:NAD-dependent epimerase/dehydratase family protein [archaeon]
MSKIGENVKYTMKKILVVGGSKFIGKELLKKLSTKNDEIVVINRGTVGKEEYLPKNARHISVDRNDKEAMKKAIGNDKFDIIYDICAVTADHVKILIEVLNQKPSKHIHVSSGSVYDMYREESPIFSLPFSEDFPIGPIEGAVHPYMEGKRDAEKILYEEFDKNKYPMIIVRPTFVYGPNNYIYREAYFFDRINNGRPILIPNKGNGFQDLVYVEDLVDLMVLLAESEDKKILGEAYNATKGNIINANQFVKSVEKVLKKKADIVYYDVDEITEMGWTMELQLYPYMPEGGNCQDARKIEQDLGFKNQLSYIEGLTKSFEWWLENGEKREESELEKNLIDYIKSKGKADEENLKEILRDMISKEQRKIKEQT